MNPKKNGRLLPGTFAHGLMGALAFIMALCVTLSCLGWLGLSVVTGDDLKREALSASIPRQLEYIGEAVDAAAAQWHFDAEGVKALITRERLAAYQRQVLDWFDGVLAGQLDPLPAWDTYDMVEAVRADELFAEYVPALDRRTVARDSVAASLARTIERAVFPLRYQLVIIVMDKVSHRLDVPAALRKTALLPLVGLAGALALALLITLASLRRVSRGLAFIGSGCVASALMLAASAAALWLLDIPSLCGAMSPMLQQEAIALQLALSWRLAALCAALTLTGWFLIHHHKRELQKMPD